MATNSEWGYASSTLVGESASGNSAWGTAFTQLSGPAQAGTGAWGVLKTRLRQAPKPVAVMTGSGLAYSPILVFDGTSWK